MAVSRKGVLGLNGPEVREKGKSGGGQETELVCGVWGRQISQGGVLARVWARWCLL